MDITHNYEVAVEWQGNRGTGTSDYRAYGREVLVSAEGKPSIEGSADRAFRGNAERWNPEDELVAALSQCHLLSYLHAAVMHGIVVTSYTDSAVGVMQQTPDGGGHFVSVTLRPVVTIEAGADEVEETTLAKIQLAQSLHVEANRMCFIASSVNFPVEHEATTLIAPAQH